MYCKMVNVFGHVLLALDQFLKILSIWKRSQQRQSVISDSFFIKHVDTKSMLVKHNDAFESKKQS